MTTNSAAADAVRCRFRRVALTSAARQQANSSGLRTNRGRREHDRSVAQAVASESAGTMGERHSERERGGERRNHARATLNAFGDTGLDG
jgi:hypothetical protein